MKPILCSGEILIDFISNEKGKNLKNTELFSKKAGGSPLNVAVTISRLGLNVSFLGSLGKDQFSDYLYEILKKENINTDNIIIQQNCKTSIAYVARDKFGNPDFLFFRDNPADVNVKYEEYNINPEDYSLLHIGSISLIYEPARSSYMKFMEYFLEKNIPVSYDPNVRPSIIHNKEKFIQDFLYISSKVDIVKMSDKDLEYIFSNTNIEKIIEKIPLKKGAMLLITLGEKGCIAKYNDIEMIIPGYNVSPVDATGCGDAFTGAIIYNYIKGERDIFKLGKFANAVAAKVITKLGGVDSIPYYDEVVEFIRDKNSYL
ncbi:carbohydrate kinase [Marinitoga sp. 38H-ov]|uniref:carbohydrate kinase family protein n=1 Tax=Marinitoga sp. 38H-ov TaxID=1755814 RepID=UPI0013E9A99A|nr:carbohydrate kinase [Marinitoga sp. 38H-ov]KAF2956986.1 fructokinase [Marinitoga sp. 38H-ov]